MLNPGQLINLNFIIIRSLGAGCFGETYQAFDQKHQRNCCLKTLNKRSFNFDLLINELSSLKRIDHPNILKTYGYSEKTGENGIECIVTEFIEGETLESRLRSGQIDAEMGFTIMRELVEGLQTVHAAGLIHRDLKPDNILLTYDLGVKIIDFGLALHIDGPAIYQDGKRTAGCRLYRAPEQIDQQATAASDIYALGIIFHQLFTREMPSYNSTVRMFELSPFAGVSSEFDAFFQKLTHPTPSLRIQSCEAITMELTSLYKVFQFNLADIQSSQLDGDYFRLSYFEDFDKMIVTLGAQFESIRIDISNMRIDGLRVDPSEKFDYPNFAPLISFLLEGRYFKITGDTSLSAIAELLRLYKYHARYAVIEPTDFMIMRQLPDGIMAIRLVSNFEPLIGNLRGNGFYCYEMSEDEVCELRAVA